MLPAPSRLPTDGPLQQERHCMGTDHNAFRARYDLTSDDEEAHADPTGVAA